MCFSDRFRYVSTETIPVVLHFPTLVSVRAYQFDFFGVTANSNLTRPRVPREIGAPEQTIITVHLHTICISNISCTKRVFEHYVGTKRSFRPSEQSIVYTQNPRTMDFTVRIIEQTQPILRV